MLRVRKTLPVLEADAILPGMRAKDKEKQERKGRAMKKIPTLFERTFEGNKVVGITDKVREGMEWVLNDEGTATVKWDGACCAIINGELYKRFDAKPGRKIPEGAMPCCDPDPITGHWPHWVKCDPDNPADKWFFAADPQGIVRGRHPEGIKTYEAIGKHFNGNPYKLTEDFLVQHGVDVIKVERTFKGIREYLRTQNLEGIVFWKDGEPQCKIKKTDFGFPWNK